MVETPPWPVMVIPETGTVWVTLTTVTDTADDVVSAPSLSVATAVRE